MKTSQKYLKRLEKHKLERVDLLQEIESWLHKGQKKPFSPLKKDTSVVLLVSGGIDSTVAWEWLLKEGVVVYPLTIVKNELGYGWRYKQAVKYFSNYFAKKYPGKSKPVKFWTVKVSPPEVDREQKQLRGKFLDYRSRLHYFNNDRLVYGVGTVGIMLPVLYGAYYQQYLWDRYHEKVDKLALGVLPDDGRRVLGQTLTHIRLQQLHFSQFEGHQDLQIFSPWFEPFWDRWVSKVEVVRLAIRWGIPLEKTWSCAGADNLVCGRCDSCLNRKRVFNEVGLRLDEVGPVEKWYWIYEKFSWLQLGTGLKTKLAAHSMSKSQIKDWWKNGLGLPGF